MCGAMTRAERGEGRLEDAVAAAEDEHSDGLCSEKAASLSFESAFDSWYGDSEESTLGRLHSDGEVDCDEKDMGELFGL